MLFATTASAQSCPPASDQALRVGVLPVLNTLPIFVAQQEGLYEAEGVRVELVPVESARDRGIGLQTGQLDVGNNDVIGALLQIAGGDDLKIVRHDAFAPGVRFFSLVTGPESGLEDAQALIEALEEDRAQIALARNTVTEYVATELLRQAGYEPEPDDFLEVSDIPLRLEQLAQGTVAAALLPEPLTTLATAVQGAHAVLDDTELGFVPVALSVRQEVLDERPGDVCRFLAAYEAAVARINADPEAYRQNEIRIPEPVRATYQVPRFLPYRVPTPEELEAVERWMQGRGLLDAPVPYEDAVDDGFAPPQP